MLKVFPGDQEDNGGAVDETESEAFGAWAALAAGTCDLTPECDVKVRFLIEELGAHHLCQGQVGAMVMDEDVAAMTHDKRLHLSLYRTHCIKKMQNNVRV